MDSPSPWAADPCLVGASAVRGFYTLDAGEQRPPPVVTMHVHTLPNVPVGGIIPPPPQRE